MKQPYLETISLIERLHRHFLDVVRAELDHLGVDDINNVQSLILFNISDEEVTVGELTHRGYYLGTNVTYNLKKLVEHGYVSQERSPRDRRSVRVKLTEKGLELCQALDGAFERHVAALKEGVLEEGELEDVIESLRRVERFWTAAIAQGVPGVGRKAA